MNIDIKRYAKLLCISILILSLVLIFIFYLYLYPIKYRKEIEFYGNEYGVETALIASIINTESSFNKDSKSSKGAIGLMQILPATADYVYEMMNEKSNETIDLTNPSINIKIGTYYLKYLINKFESQNLAIIAYNAGEGKVKAWLNDKNYSPDGKNLKTIPYEETKNYFQKVTRGLNIYKTRF